MSDTPAAWPGRPTTHLPARKDAPDERDEERVAPRTRPHRYTTAPGELSR
ncbi:MAG: hypothetical protein R3B09_32040 [Nannocystaceae bacterium]